VQWSIWLTVAVLVLLVEIILKLVSIHRLLVSGLLSQASRENENVPQLIKALKSIEATLDRLYCSQEVNKDAFLRELRKITDELQGIQCDVSSIDHHTAPKLPPDWNEG